MGFTSAVELISLSSEKSSKELTESSNELTREDFKKEIWQEFIRTIQQETVNMKMLSSFMLMAINRCIDFAKASHNVALVARHESFDLMEALDLPLTLMCNMQQKVTIKLNPVPPEIARTVITDKHWLQENLLSLLSNSEKYSPQGTVTITVSLRDEASFIRKIKSKTISNDRDKSIFIEDSIHTKSIWLLELLNFLIVSIIKIINNPFSILQKKVISEKLSFKKTQVDSSNNDMTIMINQIDMLTVQDDDTDNNKEVLKYLVFEVEDQGIGIASDARNSLFTPFQKIQRSAGGTGLGLYSLAKRIDALDGMYGILDRSDGQQGVNIWFAIPYKPDLSNESTNRTQLPHSIMDSISDIPRPLKILLVDDSITTQKMLSKVLARYEHHVDVAANGVEAFDMIQSNYENKTTQYDLVLMDIQMPIMDGLEATKRLRQYESTLSSDTNKAHVAIIGCSANSDHDTMLATQDVGMDSFICKPFTYKAFLECHERLIKEKTDNKTPPVLSDTSTYFGPIHSP